MDDLVRVNLSELIAEKIKNDIQSGVYKPGQRLPPHEELCEKWKVSRVTLREALKKLEVLKIIEIHQGKGTFVRDIGLELVKDSFSIQPLLGKEAILTLIEARKAIETALARYAAIRRDQEGIAGLGALIKKLERLAEENDSLGYAIVDFQFHKQIGTLAKNSVLLLMLEKIQTLILDQQRSMFEYGKESSSLKSSLSDHKAIFATILEGDADGAEKTMGKHLSNMDARIRKAYLKGGTKKDQPNAR
ncbi:MAG: FadR/GntR family transcriptional regulator [Rectinemataceae bacterium]